jgi:DNA-binding LacI/PurR family transcriptional regulator
MKASKDKHPTIYDVAEASGASISTISRVLNSPELVSEATRSKVLEAIDRLGYVPKAEARARALQSSCRVGVLTPFFIAPSFVQRLRGIDAALAQTNHELVIYTVESLSRLQGYLLNLPLTGNLDGLIIMSLPYDQAAAARLAQHGPETVSIEFSHPNFSSVEIDDFAGGRLAARYLIAKGHRRCAFIGDIDPPNYAINPAVSRLEGFRQGLAEANLPLTDEYIRSSHYDQEPSQRAAHWLLTLPEPPTAIFSAADIQAIAILKVARELGLEVPRDLAIIGFDDLDLADYIGLTTIRQPLDDSGRIAVELLLSRLNNPNYPVQHVNLPLQIVERDTA